MFGFLRSRISAGKFDRRAIINRRTLLLSGASSAAFAALAGRLYSLQVVQSDEFATLSDDNRFYHQLSPPRRGKITDRKGIEIAGSIENFQVYATPYQVENRDQTLRKVLSALHPYGHVDERRHAGLLTSLNQYDNRYRPVPIADNLDWEAFARVNIIKPELAGVQAEVGETRAYGLKTRDGDRIHADAFAHVVGYVSKPSQKVLQDRLDEEPDLAQRRRIDREMKHPAARVGREGLELTMDQQLRGSWGALRVERDARGRVVRTVGFDENREPEPGRDLALTLDADVQAYAQQRLYGESGAAVAMDVRTGEIICMASAPGFDPNLFAAGIGSRAYRALRNDERKPLFNKPLTGLYAPGSTFKMITAMAALRAGVITPEKEVYCSGKIRLGDREFHCWKDEGHGSVDLRSSLKNSCDCYYYELARELYRTREGTDFVAQVAEEFGVGHLGFDLAVPGERDGVVPGPDYDLRLMRENQDVPVFNAQIEAFNLERQLPYERRSDRTTGTGQRAGLPQWYIDRARRFNQAVADNPLPDFSWLTDQSLTAARYNAFVGEYNRIVNAHNGIAREFNSEIITYVNQFKYKRRLAQRLPRLSLGDRLNEAIGQGYVLASPLQLAVMTARIANGGRKVEPVILKDDVPSDDDLAALERVGDPLHIQLMQDAMFSVTEEAGGTAFYALRRNDRGGIDFGRTGLDVAETQMAGKTGTSQVRRITAEERAQGVVKNEDLPWRRRDHGLFVGYAPFDNPRYAIAVIVEHGGGGSTAAARPARDILKRILECDGSLDAEALPVCDVTRFVGLPDGGSLG